MKIKISAASKVARIYDMTLREFMTLLKFNIKMFVSPVTTVQLTDKKPKIGYIEQPINIIERTSIGDVNQVVAKIKKGIKTEEVYLQYNTFIDLFKKYISEDDSEVIIEIPLEVYQKNKILLSYIKSINFDIVDSCVFVGLYDDSETIEIRFKDGVNGSNALYYFDNDTVLLFSDKGPELITDNSQISNFIDIVS